MVSYPHISLKNEYTYHWLFCRQVWQTTTKKWFLLCCLQGENENYKRVLQNGIELKSRWFFFITFRSYRNDTLIISFSMALCVVDNKWMCPYIYFTSNRYYLLFSLYGIWIVSTSQHRNTPTHLKLPCRLISTFCFPFFVFANIVLTFAN